MPDAPPLALVHRRAPVAPSTFDAPSRTVEVTASTFAPVPRGAPNPAGGFTPWQEELDPAGLDLSDFHGAPVLADHANRTDALIGRVEAARLVGRELRARVRFAETPRAAEIMALVGDGTLRGVSLGYSVNEYRRGGERDGVPVFIAAAWQPRELSFTPIPADPSARVRSAGAPSTTREQEGRMPDNNTPAARAAPTTSSAPPAPDLATRAAELRTIGRSAEPLLGRAAVDEIEQRALAEGWSDAQMRAECFNALTGRGAHVTVPAAPRGGVDHSDPAVIRARMAEALAARVLGRDVQGPAAEWRGATVVQLAAALLEARGEHVARHAPPSQIVQRALTTSDFPALLTATQSRLLQDRLAVAPGAARTICARREARDFRPGRFLQFAGVRDLALLRENGEMEMSPPNERGETFAIKTYARQLRITRQALVNDDLGAFDGARLFADAAVASEAAQFVTMFAPNGAGWGPTLDDGQPLFHTSRSNVATGSMNTLGVSNGRAAMRAQTDASGNLIAPTPAWILCGPSRETEGEQTISALTVATAENQRPVFAGRLQLAVEPRLTGGPTAPWFLFADPAVQPVLALIYLAGTNGVPTVTEQRIPGFDGMGWDVVHDFAIAPMSFVGACRLTGQP